MRYWNKQIQMITKKIVKEYQPEKIILFGSCALGNANSNSDIDLLIIKKSRKERIQRERELRKLLFGNRFPPIDLLIYTPTEVSWRLSIKDFFIQDILSKGTILYEK